MSCPACGSSHRQARIFRRSERHQLCLQRHENVLKLERHWWRRGRLRHQADKSSRAIHHCAEIFRLADFRVMAHNRAPQWHVSAHVRLQGFLLLRKPGVPKCCLKLNEPTMSLASFSEPHQDNLSLRVTDPAEDCDLVTEALRQQDACQLRTIRGGANDGAGSRLVLRCELCQRWCDFSYPGMRPASSSRNSQSCSMPTQKDALGRTLLSVAHSWLSDARRPSVISDNP